MQAKQIARLVPEADSQQRKEVLHQVAGEAVEELLQQAAVEVEEVQLVRQAGAGVEEVHLVSQVLLEAAGAEEVPLQPNHLRSAGEQAGETVVQVEEVEELPH